mmetsp:Transcript_107814/g.347895  ORF Transcript_107814/g.347895 Transcript_107814/m.347895 type:complete len:208 (+) Transcript_107814:33-656(+)
MFRDDRRKRKHKKVDRPALTAQPGNGHATRGSLIPDARSSAPHGRHGEPEIDRAGVPVVDARPVLPRSVVLHLGPAQRAGVVLLQPRAAALLVEAVATSRLHDAAARSVPEVLEADRARLIARSLGRRHKREPPLGGPRRAEGDVPSDGPEPHLDAGPRPRNADDQLLAGASPSVHDVLHAPRVTLQRPDHDHFAFRQLGDLRLARG